MALLYVGGAVASGNSANYTINIASLTGGAGSAAQAGDLVIVATGNVNSGGNAADAGVTTAGFDEVVTLAATDTNRCNFSVNWKIMTGTPDTVVTCQGTGDATRGSVAVAHVWRNVEPTTPFDATATTATGTNTGVPDPPSITPVTAGAIVIAAGFAAVNSVGTTTAPSGYSNLKSSTSDPGGTAAQIGMASKAWSGSGAENPGTFGGFDTDGTNSWCAATLVLEPGASVSTKHLALLGIG